MSPAKPLRLSSATAAVFFSSSSMRSWFVRFLAIAACMLIACLARADDPIAAATIWSFKDLSSVNGVPWDVWGSPKIQLDGPDRGVRFDGKVDGLIAPTIPIANWKNFTVEILFCPDSEGGLPEQRFLHLEDEKKGRMLIELRILPEGVWCLDTFLYSGPAQRSTLIDRTKMHSLGRWHWAAVTYGDGHMIHYVDGVKECEGSIQFEPMHAVGRTSVGVRQNKVSWFKGVIREVRFTPATLPPEKLQRSVP